MYTTILTIFLVAEYTTLDADALVTQGAVTSVDLVWIKFAYNVLLQTGQPHIYNTYRDNCSSVPVSIHYSPLFLPQVLQFMTLLWDDPPPMPLEEITYSPQLGRMQAPRPWSVTPRGIWKCIIPKWTFGRIDLSNNQYAYEKWNYDIYI